MSEIRKKARFRKYMSLIFIGVVITMFGMIVANIVYRQGNVNSYGLGEFTTIDESWRTEEGEVFQISEIDSYAQKDGIIYACYELPEELEEGQSLVFRSKNCYVTISIDNQTVYETQLMEAPFYNHSPGTRWNLVRLKSEDAGKKAELQIRQAYSDHRAKVDNFYFGDSSAIIIYLISQKSFGLVTCLLMLFIGLLYILADIVLNWSSKEKDYSLMYLAAFAIVAAIWGLLETNVFQLFISNLRLLQVMDNMMLVLGAMPLYLYMDSIYDIFKIRIFKILCVLDMVYLVLSTVSQICGLWDYHQTLNGAVFNYGFVVFILIFGLVRQGMELKRRKKKSSVYHIYQQLGIGFLGLAVAGDLYRYLTSDVMDRAFIMRIGLLFFILFFGLGNIHRMIHLLQKGVQAEFISKLAYTDGLTEVGNRTAYMERVEEIRNSKTKKPLGIMMLDINNLKQTNDIQGHQVGDELIRVSVKIIRNTFEGRGEIYRIGGDEFIVLISGENVQSVYEEAILEFNKRMEAENQTEKHTFEVSIAHGFAMCEKPSGEALTAVEKEADSNMYENKRRMKAARQQL